ncbi:Uncharacterised protein [Amycolatopsis camponoti]|uniref:Uncharacterized protein n=1 Tax=Amycolatopsis camponoti TaxID=2606593 RepID=A0A6I8LNA9_9PSEU|nr:Uncharacterised protein [Amycolatopsis camponoti]
MIRARSGVAFTGLRPAVINSFRSACGPPWGACPARRRRALLHPLARSTALPVSWSAAHGAADTFGHRDLLERVLQPFQLVDQWLREFVADGKSLVAGVGEECVQHARVPVGASSGMGCRAPGCRGSRCWMPSVDDADSVADRGRESGGAAGAHSDGDPRVVRGRVQHVTAGGGVEPSVRFGSVRCWRAGRTAVHARSRPRARSPVAHWRALWLRHRDRCVTIASAAATSRRYHSDRHECPDQQE